MASVAHRLLGAAVRIVNQGTEITDHRTDCGAGQTDLILGSRSFGVGAQSHWQRDRFRLFRDQSPLTEKAGIPAVEPESWFPWRRGSLTDCFSADQAGARSHPPHGPAESAAFSAQDARFASRVCLSATGSSLSGNFHILSFLSIVMHYCCDHPSSPWLKNRAEPAAKSNLVWK